jgi:hypothetical protein
MLTQIRLPTGHSQSYVFEPHVINAGIPNQAAVTLHYAEAAGNHTQTTTFTVSADADKSTVAAKLQVYFSRTKFTVTGATRAVVQLKKQGASTFLLTLEETAFGAVRKGTRFLPYRLR